jgi:hypothetical protein
MVSTMSGTQISNRVARPLFEIVFMLRSKADTWHRVLFDSYHAVRLNSVREGLGNPSRRQSHLSPGQVSPWPGLLFDRHQHQMERPKQTDSSG